MNSFDHFPREWVRWQRDNWVTPPTICTSSLLLGPYNNFCCWIQFDKCLFLFLKGFVDKEDARRSSSPDCRRSEIYCRSSHRSTIHLVFLNKNKANTFVSFFFYMFIILFCLSSPHQWILKFNPALKNDSGNYLCHVSTDPPMIRSYQLEMEGTVINNKITYLNSKTLLKTKKSIMDRVNI